MKLKMKKIAIGARAYVTDATACTFAGALTGGASTFCPVISNGTTWKVVNEYLN